MARFRLDLEYVGTRYSGWQAQKNARTVQGALHEAVRRVAERTDFESYGSGRTDAGVHALQQVAHLDLETRLAPETLRRALNDELPADIHVLAPGEGDPAVPRAPLGGRRAATSTRSRGGARPSASRSCGGSATRSTARRSPRPAGCSRGCTTSARTATRSPAEGSTRVKLERVQVEEAGDARPRARPRLALPVEDGAAPGRA